MSRRQGRVPSADQTAVPPRHSFDAVFLDVDDDGDQDIYVAADAGPSMLFIGDGAGQFRERGMYAGVGLSEAGTAQAGPFLVRCS